MPASIWRYAAEATDVADALTYLTGVPSPADCSADSFAPKDRLSLRVDLEADAKEFDRTIGGWFGRTGGRSRSVIDVGIVMTTWISWRHALLEQAVVVPDACYTGIASAAEAADALTNAAEAVWGYAKGLKGYDSDFSPWTSNVNAAMDRSLAEAAAILQSCG